MTTLVQCKDCDHLFHDKAAKVPPTLLSCRAKQKNPEQRAAYMGPEFARHCEGFTPRQAQTVNPMPAMEVYMQLLRDSPKPQPMDLLAPASGAVVTQFQKPAARPSRPLPRVTSNSPFDLGARPVPQPAPSNTKEHDPFNLEAA